MSGNARGSSKIALPATADSFTLIISGHPEGKGRPKFGKGRAWTPKKTVLAEGEVTRKWEEIGSPRMPDDAPLRIDLTLYVVRPDGHYKKGGELSAEGQRNPRPLKVKPDIDNAIKLVFDALNTKAFRDDVRFVEAHIERHWADWPAVKIKITTL